MKITAIKAYPVWVGIRNQLLVKVETDEGIYGWGESGLSGRELAVVGAIEHYREFLVGRDPMRIGRALAGDVPQPVFRGRARADRRHLGASTSRCTTSRARRWACRSTSCSAASSATGCRSSRPPGARRARSMIEEAQAAASSMAGPCIRLDRTRRTQATADDASSSRASRSASTAHWLAKAARGASGRRVGAGHRLPPPPVAWPRPPRSASGCRRARSTSWRSRSATRRPRPTSRCAR